MDANEWQEVPHDPNFRWKTKPKKLRLYADANVPKIIVEEIRNSGVGVPVWYAHEDGAGTWDDGQVRQRAHKLGCVLLTFDRGLWYDGEHPLNRSAGIIFVDIPNDQKEAAIEALGTFYGGFAQCWPGDRWEKQKVRVYKGGFVWKFINWEGKIKEIDHRFENGRWYAREIR